MDWWSVSVEARSDNRGELAEDAVGKFLALTEPYSGSVSMAGSPARWTATVSVETLGAAEAIGEGVRLVILLAAEAGLPVWPVVRAEATRQDLYDNGSSPAG
jgi:hypothetical protein